MRSSHAERGRKAWCTVAVSLLSLLCVTLAGSAADVIDITGVDVRVVHGASALGASQNQAAVGDLLHIRADVRNVGTETVDRVHIDFFFTEQVTGEHGKIGTQTVYEMISGDEKRPVVTLDTTGFTPGIYRFTAALLDPEDELGDDVTGNNRYEQEISEGTALLTAGAGISELTLTTTFGQCQLGSTVLENPLLGTRIEQVKGGITDAVNLSIYNVGTNPLSNAPEGDEGSIAVSVQYRLSPDGTWSTLGTYSPDATDNTLTVKFGDIEPGAQKDVLLSNIDYTALERIYRPTDAQKATFSVLGNEAGAGDPLFLRVLLTAAAGESGITQQIFLPSESTGATIYSDRDLWTYPQRTECGCTVGCDRVCTTVGPVLSGVYLFHVTEDAAGKTHLDVLDVRSGARVATWDAPSRIVTEAALSFDSHDVQEWTVYVGTSDGAIHSLVLQRTDEGVVTFEPRSTSAWSPPAGLVTGLESSTSRPTTHFLLTDPTVSGEDLADAALIVASANGLFVLNASSGSSVKSYEARSDIETPNDTDFQNGSRMSVTLAPAYAGGLVWFAAAQYLVGLDVVSGSACTYRANDLISTPLDLSGDAGSLFFGTGFGTIYALEPDGVLTVGDGEDDRSLACPTPASMDTGLRTIAGIATGQDNVRDGDRDIVVYAVGEQFSVWKIEYVVGDDFQRSTEVAAKQVRAETSTGALVPWTASTVPAIVQGTGGVETVFFSGMFRDTTEGATAITRPALYALNGNLDRVKRFTTWNETVEFVFKLEEATVPFLSPVWFESKDSVIIAVPGDYLYAFNGQETQ